MDTEGVTVVRSPHALAQWAIQDYRSVLTDLQPSSPPPLQTPSVTPFQAIRGTGQGNPDSPTCWNAAFDIALTALMLDSRDRGTEQYSTGKDGNSIIGSELGYADDLVSVHELATEIQRKADIMSAFCAICGVTLSHKKLRRVVQSWIGSQNIITSLNMQVHDYGWIPVDITIRTEGATDYLGGLYDVDDTGSTSHSTVQDISSQHASILSTIRAFPETILMCYSVATSPKVVYKQQLNSLTLSQFEETDQVFYPTLVRATRNMWGFPKALFHLPPTLCGYGVLSTVDRTMLSKWASLHSALYSNDDQSLAAEGLLHRITADQGHHLLPGQGVILGTPHRKSNRWWLTSLLEWGATKSLMQTGHQTNRRLHSSSHHHRPHLQFDRAMQLNATTSSC